MGTSDTLELFQTVVTIASGVTIVGGMALALRRVVKMIWPFIIKPVSDAELLPSGKGIIVQVKPLRLKQGRFTEFYLEIVSGKQKVYRP